MKSRELLDRYLRELTKYMAYDNAKSAERDIREIVEEELPENYTEEDLKKILLKLGSPYSLAAKYESKSNILISGKNYTIYIDVLKVLSIQMILALVIYFIFNRKLLSILNVLRVLKTEMITIFFSATISLWIAEKVKSTKIMSNLVKSFRIEDLYIKKPKLNKPLAFPLLCNSLFLFIVIANEVVISNDASIKILQAILFLLILRDSNKLAEDGYGRYVTFLAIFCDVISLLLIYPLLVKYFYSISFFKISLCIVGVAIIFDLVLAVSQVLKINKTQ